MKSKIIAVDLAKEVFEVAVANDQYRLLERRSRQGHYLLLFCHSL